MMIKNVGDPFGPSTFLAMSRYFTYREREEPHADGRFRLKVGEMASIVVVNGDYTVTEILMTGYEQVVPANGEAA